ncbi:hypothetical protein KFE25_003070 [Diacronema lutheri]|uniref:Uncharacterized protein n=2 Tax=Diacronema lutheri TaxID=2081491 RepID=A0A8J5X8P3_DIALT|nr:hypothetical protein KFE25_003070 [Diacronema lutheri]
MARRRLRFSLKLLLLLGGAGRAVGWKVLRAFESKSPERLGADVCWSKRQIEKEEFENLRLEHLACLAKTGTKGTAQSSLSDLGGKMVHERLPDDQCKTLPVSASPLKDRKTGLCTWQALAMYPKGEWVSKRQAAHYLGPSAFANYGKETVGMKGACASKRNWYRCPSFNHDREWLPEIVRQGKCAMRFVTPPMLYNITGRPLRVLLHGDSLFKGTFKSFVCQFNEWVEWERHFAYPRKESHFAEVWLAQVGPLLVQYNYRDGSYNYTSELAKSTPLLDIDEFDVIFTNYGYGSGSYREMTARRGYNGPIVGVSHACARCRATDPKLFAQCADNSVRKLDCTRRAGVLSIDFCTMTLPYNGYKAQWAPGGTVMNSMDPHMCSPGPDDQLVNHMMHVMASYFRK